MEETLKAGIFSVQGLLISKDQFLLLESQF